MRSRLAVCAAALIASACGAKAPYEYPPRAAVEFHRQCPADNPACVCTWDEITRAMPHDEYQAALERFTREGLMDPRITRARGRCREKHAGEGPKPQQDSSP